MQPASLHLNRMKHALKSNNNNKKRLHAESKTEYTSSGTTGKKCIYTKRSSLCRAKKRKRNASSRRCFLCNFDFNAFRCVIDKVHSTHSIWFDWRDGSHVRHKLEHEHRGEHIDSLTVVHFHFPSFAFAYIINRRKSNRLKSEMFKCAKSSAQKKVYRIPSFGEKQPVSRQCSNGMQ